jgi:lysophospholipase L1-like esterase
MTKTILCYGDSLTWGYDSVGPSRHAYEDRWPSVLQAELGAAARVIPDGLNGRTTAFDDHIAAADRNGARTLATALLTHAPLDLVVIMLGANDMKPWIHGSPFTAKYGLLRLVEIVRGTDYGFGWAAPKILLVSPPPITRTEHVEFKEFFAGGEAASQHLARLYAELAGMTGCGFFDAGSAAQTTPLDGIHLDAENTRAIGRAITPVVRKMLEL